MKNYMQLIVSVLLIPFYLYSMAPEQYDSNRALDFPLKDHFTHPDCERLKDETQEKKDAALKNVLDQIPDDNYYPVRRHHIADLVKIGANPNIKGPFQPIREALNFNDYYLLDFLIKHGININIRITGADPISYAHTKAIAQLLLDHGANIAYKSSLKENLLFNAMWQQYKKELIPLYRKKGLSPLEYSRFENSPLHELVIAIPINAIAKASLLLEGLTPQEAIELISHKNCNKKSVIDALNEYTDTDRKQLLEYLKKKLAKAQINKIQYPKNFNLFQEQLSTLFVVLKKRKDKLLRNIIKETI